MLEEFAASFAARQIITLTLVGGPTTATMAAQLEDEAPTVVSCLCTCGLPGRQQTPSQHADANWMLQTPPPCST